MKQERGMFRIYRCPQCNNIGYTRVESEDDLSACSLCRGIILHESGTLYAATVQESVDLVRELVILSKQNGESSKPTRGRGLRKRILTIIISLIDLNRGKPVPLREILRECVDADIALERAMTFLELLETEGILLNFDSKISLKKEVIQDGRI
ncbi:MAG: hypothetical protein BAJATHORv1_40143 [Candidatus Thorarchaeota archaeon]|nr:MAG: hypothetical protein BAJATHORv1_40143 [Candidatus Thorarchaeota archaeon]